MVCAVSALVSIRCLLNRLLTSWENPLLLSSSLCNVPTHLIFQILTQKVSDLPKSYRSDTPLNFPIPRRYNTKFVSAEVIPGGVPFSWQKSSHRIVQWGLRRFVLAFVSFLLSLFLLCDPITTPLSRFTPNYCSIVGFSPILPLHWPSPVSSLPPIPPFL